MAITIDFTTGVISVPKADMTLVQSLPKEIYDFDLISLWKRLRLLEDSENGRVSPIILEYTPSIVVEGTPLAEVIEINESYYSITFEDGQYAVNLVGANSNVGSVSNINQVSLRSQNTAGLIKSTGSGGDGITEADFHNYQDSYANKDGYHADLTLLERIGKSSQKIVGTQVIMYDEIGEIQRWDLSDIDNNPSNANVFNRVKT